MSLNYEPASEPLHISVKEDVTQLELTKELLNRTRRKKPDERERTLFDGSAAERIWHI